MSIVQKLTENIVERDLQKEGAALLNKWEKTGLLEGLDNDNAKNGMARLLENQAKELLREASTLSAGDVEGFAAVAFPIVRRVFGGLIANDLVSVQPMSLPSGLIFFLDFTYSDEGFVNSNFRNGVRAEESVYGGQRVGQQLTGGVNLGDPQFGNAQVLDGAGGMYDLGNAYASPTGSKALTLATDADFGNMSNGEIGHNGGSTNVALGGAVTAISALTETQKKALKFDPDVLASTSTDKVMALVVKLATADMNAINLNQLAACTLAESDGSAIDGGGDDQRIIRRLTHLGVRSSTDGSIIEGTTGNHITFYMQGTSGVDANLAAAVTLFFPKADVFSSSTASDPDAVGGLVASSLDLEARTAIPEIDIKVDSIAVTARTKKLKAKWSPELGQDLNAYHNLDAEVELTSILSEHVALEIDREIINDLVTGATAATYYWSRAPGLFVNKETGAELGATSASPDFTGTVSEWYETLIETINDVSAQIHRKTLRGGANFVVCSPEVANIMEFTAGFRASVSADSDRGSIGAQRVGALNQKFEVYVDPYFPRNIVLVGRKGSSFLESGYVYAPYVPLQVTPTIFGVEDFVPRKGVMTRYAKKMVRPDMYGVVVVRGLLGEEGA